jgi:hypothetical protein
MGGSSSASVGAHCSPPELLSATGSHRARVRRWWVHVGLITTTLTSLAVEPILTAHIAIGLGFVVLVAVHLMQRRAVSRHLLAALLHPRAWRRPVGRLAIADLMLTVLTVAMLASGLWDWLADHPARIRWHALTGVTLAIFLLSHTFTRRTRLRNSHVR